MSSNACINVCQIIKLSCVKNRVPSYCWPCAYMRSCVVAKINTDIYFQCLVHAHSSNPEARELA